MALHNSHLNFTFFYIFVNDQALVVQSADNSIQRINHSLHFIATYPLLFEQPGREECYTNLSQRLCQIALAKIVCHIAHTKTYYCHPLTLSCPVIKVHYLLSGRKDNLQSR